MQPKYRKELIGKEVKIYPGDSNKKRGVILDIDDKGVLFQITYYNGSDGQYQVGKKYYISFEARLTFSEY
jgi:hypothetical protein